LALLKIFKNALLALRGEFAGNSNGRIVVEGDKRENFNRRLLLLEHEIDGLLKRKINFSLKDQEGGHSTMDYINLLNENENQIVELEKNIQNYEERLRKVGARYTMLENQIVSLTTELRRKEDLCARDYQRSAIAEGEGRTSTVNCAGNQAGSEPRREDCCYHQRNSQGLRNRGTSLEGDSGASDRRTRGHHTYYCQN
jgi:chromosome segregation ATPase